jgi:plastocyanin
MRTFTTVRLARTAALALSTSLLLVACGSSSGSSSSNSSSATTKAAPAAAAPVASGHIGVSISGYAFHPATITVKPGTKITFTNHDQTAHTATSTHKGFDTGTVQPGKSATVTFTKPGTYTYYCQFHAFMHGTVIVK